MKQITDATITSHSFLKWAVYQAGFLHLVISTKDGKTSESNSRLYQHTKYFFLLTIRHIGYINL